MRDIGALSCAALPLAPSCRSAPLGRLSIAPPRLANASGTSSGSTLRAAVALSVIAPQADDHDSPAAHAVETAVTLNLPDDPDLPLRGAGRMRARP